MSGTGSSGFGRGEIDNLTQTDVDRLLQSRGGRPARERHPAVEIVPYNFLRPPRISKDRRAVLNSIFSRFAATVQSMLSSRLRVVMDISCSVEQASFGEYTMSIASPCAAFVFELGSTAQGEGAIDFSTELAFFFIDRIFGGPGDPVRLDRPLTSLERTVMRGIADRVLVSLQEAWAEHLGLEPKVLGFESTPDLLRIANAEDNVLVVNMEVRSGNTSGLIVCCIPLLALEGFLSEKTSARQAVAPGRAAMLGQFRKTIEERLRAARVELAVRFPPLRLSAREIAELKVGQIIATTQPIDGPVELHINGQRRFRGVIGDNQKALGFRITEPTDRATVGALDRPTRGRIRTA